MWSQIILCLLVGLAYASNNPGWNPENRYMYLVHGRSLASLNQVSNDYSGIVFKAELYIQPLSESTLGAFISNSKYAQIHAKLEDGWETEISESELTYKPLPLSSKPFQIVMERGAIRNIIVNKQIKNWEANMIKSIVSQLQLDTKATNLIESSINILTQEDSNTAVFKTMEETVTGVSETLYEIHPYPEYVLQTKPWVVPHKELIGDGEVIEVVKTKNFTHTQQAPSYHVGFEGIHGYQPGNKVGNFLTRVSVGQAVITGTLDKFFIQSSVTVEEIVLSPTQVDAQKGSVNSKLNVTLFSVAKPYAASEYNVESPVDVGVIYGYNNPYGTDNGPRPAKEYDHATDSDSAESSGPSKSRDEYSGRSKRALRRSSQPKAFSYASYQPNSIEEEDWHQDKPQLNEAPASPLLPLTVGYDGQAYKKQKNIIENARKLAEEIGQETLHPKEILKEHTVGKFVFLAGLVRTMNENEIQQVASQLYPPEEQSEQSPAWTIYRDAVSQAGTGAALVNIKQWIETNKVPDHEGARLIAVTAKAARQPTEEYMKAFFEMIQSEKIMEKPVLNETLLLSYTTLVHEVYANRGDSHGKYPVYSFGSFRTVRGQDHVKKTIIPHLTRKLNEAISNADTEKIHTYIRALGNIGQQHILEAFEPYLEGQKKASHFQRVLMVVALDQLVRSNPRVARSVLYKIYQNPSEAKEVRVAAVYQLMQTGPSAAMLQRMASYTNVDTSSDVNAAVKSSIETASELQSPEHARLRKAALSAKPLLTSQEYGAQYSHGYLRKYIVDELGYKQQLNFYGGDDHAIPKGLQYMLVRHFGAVDRHIVTMHAMVSSVEDLVIVYRQQTKEYQKELLEKQNEHAITYPYSSDYIAKLLDIQNTQREQLEGYVYYHMDALQKIFSFDNHTLKDLPKTIKKLEDELKEGQHYEHSKMSIRQESALAVPTVVGLPFLYTFDLPAFVKYEADVKAIAKPEISTGIVLQKPDTIEAEFDVNVVIAARIQSQLGIFTPFDHQRYSAGYIRNFQFVLPINGKLYANVQKKQLKIEVQNPGNQENVQLAHYSSWPYTSQNEIYSPKPELNIIRSKNPYKINTVVGEKATGVAVYVELTSDQRIDPAFYYDKFSNENLVSAFVKPWVDENIQHVHLDVGIDSSKSSTQQVNLYLGYRYEYQPNDPNSKRPDPSQRISQIPPFSDDPEKRLQEFVDKVGEYVYNAHVVATDATAEFQGQSNIKYSATVGVAKSNVDILGKYMGLVRKLEKQVPKTLGYVEGASLIPNTNGLNLDVAMEMDPTVLAYFQGLLNKDQRLSSVTADVKFSKSEERVEYLKEEEDYKECKRQMQEGNYQLPICARMTAKANLLDKFLIAMKYHDMDPHIINATYKAYSILRHSLYPRVEENIIDPPSSNELNIHGGFSPDLHSVNFSISSDYGNAEVRNAHVGHWPRQLLVPHPVFHAPARLLGESQKYDTYRPICVVDKLAISTLDNKTYPASLPSAWTVLLQFIPNRPSSQPDKPYETVVEQLHQHVEAYIAYGRAPQPGSPQKEFQIVLQTPSTNGKVAKIVLKPSREGTNPKVYVNDQEVKYVQEYSTDFYSGHVQVYALSNQEVKVEIHNAFYVIYDGQRAKFTVVNSKFRDAARGLCGTFTGEPETDFLGPDNCILHSSEKFIESYTVPTAEPLPRGYQMNEERECYQKKVVFANYISNEDAGRSSNYERRSKSSCTKLQTQYVEEHGEICFTVRPLPVCKPSCRKGPLISKSVPVYCEKPKASNAVWKAEIRKGASPDFSLQEPSRTIRMEMPQRCLP